jgi:PKD repeat protein
LTVTIANRIATIEIKDSEWNGTETVLFTAADPEGLTSSDEVIFTVSPVNDPPVVSDISDQSISEGNSFTAIQLDDFVDDIDNEDSEITWTATGQSNLTVTISNRIVSIEIKDSEWNGTETVLFIAADPEGFTSSYEVIFTVSPVNDPPVVSDISDQSISEGNSFTAIQLDNYVEDIDHTDSEITWTATGQFNLTVTILNRIATIEIEDSDWNGTETVLFTAADPGGSTSSDEVIFTVSPVNDPPVVSGITDQSISEGNAFTAIPLDTFVKDIDNADSEITWTATGQSNLTVTISNRIAKIENPDSDWNGTETIRFTAVDPEGLTSSDEAIFTVTPVNDPPTFSIAGDMTIDEDAGALSFNQWASNINPGAYNETDQTLTFVLTHNHQELFSELPTIDPLTGDLTMKPESNLSGISVIDVALQDDSTGTNISQSQQFTVTIQPVNDAPSFTLGENLAIKQNTAKIVENWAKQIISGPANESDQSLTFFLDAIPQDLFVHQPEIDSQTGTLTFTTSAVNNGTAIINVYLADSGDGSYTSGMKTFTIDVTSSDPPIISGLTDQHIAQDHPMETMTFSVTDTETNDSNISVSATSSDQSLVSNDNIQLTTNGSNRNISITPESGQYGTSLITVVANDGSTSTQSQFELIVHPIPTAAIGVASDAFGYTSGVVPLSVHFIPVSVVHADEVTGWKWEFSDGGVKTTEDPVYTFYLNDSSPSWYSVQLTVYGFDHSFSTTSLTDYIRVDNKKSIIVMADQTMGVAPLTVEFTATITGFDSNADYEWHFGDGNTSTLPSAAHTYEEPGNYTVTLSITDDDNSGTKILTDYIHVQGRTINGQITASDTENELINCYVEIWHQTQGLIATALSNASGDYTIQGLAAMDQLIVVAYPPIDLQSKYTHRYFDDADTRNTATPVSTLNADRSGVDITLPLAPETGIRGQIRSAKNPNTGISAMEVSAFSMKKGSGATTISDINGYYTITGLEPSDDYIISAFSETYQKEFFYSDTSPVSPEVFLLLSQAEYVDVPENTFVEDIHIYTLFTGCIHGHVSANNKDVANIWVTTISSNLEVIDGALTNGSGDYSICGLISEKNSLTMSYFVMISSSDYPFMIYNQATNSNDATLVSVGQENVNFDMKTGTNISGAVMDSSGNYLAGVTVQATSASKGTRGSAVTNASGHYTISNLTLAKDYLLEANSIDYPVIYYPDSHTPENAERVDNSTDDLSNINFVMQKGGVIKGYVKLYDASQSAGSGYWVTVFSPSLQIVKNTVTDNQGMYEFIGLDENVSDYIILMSNTLNEFMAVYYNSQGTVYTYLNAEPVQPSENIFRNLILITGYSISGKIMDINNELLSNILIYAVKTDASAWGYANSKSLLTDNHNYQITGLPPGTYDVRITDDLYLKQNKTISLSDDLQNIDFQLYSYNRSISGTIYGLSAGQSIHLWVYSMSNFSVKSKTIDGTGNDITYEINGLAGFSDYVIELISSDVPYQVYNNQKNRDDADLIDLSAESKTDIDFHVEPASIKLSGAIAFPTGSASQYVWIDVLDSQKNWVKGSSVFYSGASPVTYEITGLEKGMYFVSIWPTMGKHLYFENAETISDATQIDATQNPVSNINFTIDLGYTISGRVLDDNGKPIAGVDIDVTSDKSDNWGFATTNSEGYYFAQGMDDRDDYLVRALRDNFPALYYHSSGAVMNASLAEAVVLNSTDINFSYYAPETISGTVVNTDGQPLYDIRVDASSETYQLEHYCFTDSDGSFTFRGLPSATDYILTAVPPNHSTYQGQRISNIATPGSAISFILSAGYTLSGVLSAENDGTPISKVYITLSSLAQDIYKRVKTDSRGEFEFSGLSTSDDYAITIIPPESTNYANYQETGIQISEDKSIAIELQSALTISGYVKNSQNVPVANILITASSQDKDIMTRALSSADGTYTLYNLPYANDYVVTARPDDYAQQSFSQQSAGSIVNFTLDQGGRISGYVTTSTSIYKGATVEACSSVLNTCQSDTTDQNGYYEITSLQQSWNGSLVDYVLTVYAAGYPNMSAPQKQVGDSVNFTLTKGAENELSGTVSDSSGALLPENGKTVWVKVYKDGKYFTKTKVKTDGSGKFTVTGLSPGINYQVKVSAPEFDQEWADADGVGTTGNPGEFTTSDEISFRFSDGLW